MTQEFWEKWETVHEEPDQVRRLERAKEAACTPISIDSVKKSGYFKGTYGEYTTTLLSCECMDFLRRHKPCKHMYRLAIEFGIITESAIFDQSQVLLSKSERLSIAVDAIEKLSLEEQSELFYISEGLRGNNKTTTSPKDEVLQALIEAEIVEEKIDIKTLLQGYRRNDLRERVRKLNIPFNGNMKTEVFVEWCLENIPDKVTEICGDKTTVTFTYFYFSLKSKIYKYLYRKFMVIPHFKEGIGYYHIPRLETDLPDDDVTDQLIRMGYFHPDNIEAWKASKKWM